MAVMKSKHLKGKDLKAGRVYIQLINGSPTEGFNGSPTEGFLLLKVRSGMGRHFHVVHYLDDFGEDRTWNRRYYDDDIYIEHLFYSTKVGKQLLNLQYGDIIKSWKD